MNLLQGRTGRPDRKGQVNGKIGDQDNPQSAVETDRRLGPGQDHRDRYNSVRHGVRDGSDEIKRAAAGELSLYVHIRDENADKHSDRRSRRGEKKTVDDSPSARLQVEDIGKVLEREIRAR